ncbi:Uncharacterised protein [Mycobacteroides abscessus subsp. abscessus]|jgi:uncharacterized protein YukE|nr:Uncharacterised protein [Mycobacteroides abscessus subsp. abscessus]SKL81617.1 Uncharacterised protein [Mycobacteroides abscessus subsp. abscessus]SKM51947.1 Uncharacterised protein [Mycobacteroides abscessus subsp. abscessus]SLK34333.1 Uncharacterised protein [Mycobacteroides abscessus subsp. abscessus]
MSESIHVAFEELHRTAAVLSSHAETWKESKDFAHQSIQALTSRFGGGSSGRAMSNLVDHWEKQTSSRHEAMDGHCAAHVDAAKAFRAVEDQGIANFRSGR